MSGKRPPPRPPLPTAGQTRNGGSTVNTPGKLRSALASLTIRYNNSSTKSFDSDSEEEICIVRKEEKLSSNQEAGDREEVPINIIDENNALTHASRQHESEGSCPLLPIHSNELLGVTDQGVSEKKTITKQQTWPGNSKSNSSVKSTSSLTTGMRFLRRDQGTTNLKKDQTQVDDCKEEADSGSQPSRSHLSLHAKGNDGNIDSNRSRSPSPFRRLYHRPTNNESTNNISEKLAASTSAISLSSLLAAAATEEKHEEPESDHNNEASSEDDSLTHDISLSVPATNELIEPSTHSTLSNTQDQHEPSFTFLLFWTLLFYLYFISNLPVFVNGMVVGSIAAYLLGCLILLIICPEGSLGERFQRELDEYNLRVSLKPKPTYASKDPGLLLRPKGMKGWMLKSYDYDPNSPSDTTLVYAELKENYLTLSHPKLDAKKVDIKSVNDKTDVQVTRQDHFDLTGSNVCLVPPTLAARRIWSKKYPICLVLGQAGEVKEVIRDSTSGIDESNSKTSLQKVKSQSSVDGVSVLYLFAKTGRQKEEWYQNFERILSPKKTSSPNHTSSCSYPHYMAKLLPNMDSNQKDSHEVQLAAVNMLFGRVFWDVWQDRYWADKIKQRFQNKLSRVHKPQFIRDIHITDLSLGHTFPLINKVSPPVLDEQGTWVDFDVTYSGGVVFTVETHLNIDGYLNYFLSLGKEKEMSGDLDMAELSRKYEIIEKDELLEYESQQNADEDSQSLTSESPPESDSDFESPESDPDELTNKLKTSQQESFNNDDNDPLSPTEESSEKFYAQQALMQLKSLEGFLEKQIAEAEEMNQLEAESSSSLSLSQDSLSYINMSDSGRNSPVLKGSSSEDCSERTSLSPPPYPRRLLESPVSSPLRHRANPQTGTRKKLIGVLERLAKSKWVKKAAETKIVKTAAEKFSNLPIILSVEVQSVKGTLTLNIPPPPTNRLWYGFRDDPLLFVTARPKLGARQVKLTHVTDWIERKLKQEFKNMFVLPNMEDISIKIMNSDVERQFADN